MNYFENVKKNFGFGCMRLPMNGEEVDLKEFSQMVDDFIAEGFNYFDTAQGYIGGKSEIAVREGLTKRYPRDKYILTDKLTGTFFNKEEDIRPFFESQLAGWIILIFILCMRRTRACLKSSKNAVHMRRHLS